MKPESLSSLLAFRERSYQQFSRRADTLFEMLDALLALPSATAPAHMMLLSGFQRRWGSIYDALTAGRIDITGIEDLVAQYTLEGGERVYALDCSTWPRSGLGATQKPALTAVTIITTIAILLASRLSLASPTNGWLK